MNRNLRIIMMVILAGIFLYSVMRMIMTELEYRKAESIYTESRNEHFHVLEETTFLAPEASQETDKKEAHFPKAYVDISELQEKNQDVVGWIWIPNTKINYPILQGNDNQRYLNRSYDGEKTISGSIFMDYRNAWDFSDQNTIVYGHNMKNETMFGGLKQYAEREYMNDHSELYVFRQTKILKYHIFAAYKTESTSKSYTWNFSEQMSFERYLDYVTSCAGNALLKAPEEETPLVMLSTCTSVHKNERFVVHAAFIAEKDIES